MDQTAVMMSSSPRPTLLENPHLAVFLSAPRGRSPFSSYYYYYYYYHHHLYSLLSTLYCYYQRLPKLTMLQMDLMISSCSWLQLLETGSVTAAAPSKRSPQTLNYLRRRHPS